MLRQIATTDQTIDNPVYKLYNLTDEEIAIAEGATEPDETCYERTLSDGG